MLPSRTRPSAAVAARPTPSTPKAPRRCATLATATSPADAAAHTISTLARRILALGAVGVPVAGLAVSVAANVIDGSRLSSVS